MSGNLRKVSEYLSLRLESNFTFLDKQGVRRGRQPPALSLLDVLQFSLLNEVSLLEMLLRNLCLFAFLNIP